MRRECHRLLIGRVATRPRSASAGIGSVAALVPAPRREPASSPGRSPLVGRGPHEANLLRSATAVSTCRARTTPASGASAADAWADIAAIRPGSVSTGISVARSRPGRGRRRRRAVPPPATTTGKPLPGCVAQRGSIEPGDPRSQREPDGGGVSQPDTRRGLERVRRHPGRQPVGHAGPGVRLVDDDRQALPAGGEVGRHGHVAADAHDDLGRARRFGPAHPYRHRHPSPPSEAGTPAEPVRAAGRLHCGWLVPGEGGQPAPGDDCVHYRHFQRFGNFFGRLSYVMGKSK